MTELTGSITVGELTVSKVEVMAMATDTDQPFTVELKSQRVGEERAVILHRITLIGNSAAGGVWIEEYGSDEQVWAFLQGVKAAASMLGVYLPEVPTIP